MANKNTAGSLVVRTKEREDRLIDKIDRRTQSGKDLDNVDPIWNKHTVNENGDRCWSF